MSAEHKKRLSRIIRDGRVMLLAMDQGLEHGPKDFNAKNINPEYVLDIACKGGFTGLAIQKGIAYHYKENYSGKVPLILKLNGRTNIVPKENIYSSPVATVKEAVKLDADAIGYTLYVGSPHEAQMFHDFGMIRAECEEYGMPSIVWAYPRGQYVKDEKDPATVAYAARCALELGADIVKVNYTSSTESFKQVVAAAQRCKVISAGGSKQTDAEFLAKAREVMDAGAIGFAVGRNVWQNEHPLEMAAKLKKVVFGK
ncbi:MAG: 2-amino-3,7-dideoxy-D-threo-hept-6-ulosonate synthase [Candidatus Marsarchaeota archaeon]|nr:2-amino-3,7-dideoxy-D-threo-hept-6-ulosonate synthase [Candidatus Marsarchaeota archaeon]